jgi:hypothetical protein
MRKAIVTTVLTGLVGIGAMAAAPIAAQAATGPTTTTFGVTGGSLSITAPATATLASASLGAGSVSGQLGTVTVSDQRGALLGSWTASVISTAFTTGGGSSNETIPATDVGYNPGVVTASTGTGLPVPGVLTALGNISTSQTAFVETAELGPTSVSWNPTVTVTLPPTTVAGTYTGTITHSVA